MKGEKKLVDTNILVHGYVLISAKKHRVAKDLIEDIWKKGSGITTLQNLCGFFLVITKRIERPMAMERAKEIAKQILTSQKWQVIDRDEKTFLKAMELVKDTKVPFWDALIAVCMIENDVEVIVTENEKDFKRISGIRVINPFKGG